MTLDWNVILDGLSMTKRIDKLYEESAKYQNGKIYRIHCNVTGKDYLGSTIKRLPTRLSGHVYDNKRWIHGMSHYVSSFEIFLTLREIFLENVTCKIKARGRCYI